MQWNNAKDDAVGGGEVRLRPRASSRQASSQPIAPAAGLSPPQPAGKSIAYSTAVGDEVSGCEFLFAALAEKHNAVIRKIREIPPWEWSGEFLKLEPQVLRFLGTFAKQYPECAASKTAYTLASAHAVYRISSHKPKNLTEQERDECIAANRDLVAEYGNALLRAYRETFNFLFSAKRNTTFDVVAEIIETIRAEHERTQHEIIKRRASARILPEPRADSDCNLAGLYRRRFLSGPWSVKRRLEAARIRGDTEEAKRLTAMLEEIVGKALEAEGMEQ